MKWKANLDTVLNLTVSFLIKAYSRGWVRPFQSIYAEYSLNEEYFRDEVNKQYEHWIFVKEYTILSRAFRIIWSSCWLFNKYFCYGSMCVWACVNIEPSMTSQKVARTAILTESEFQSFILEDGWSSPSLPLFRFLVTFRLDHSSQTPSFHGT